MMRGVKTTAGSNPVTSAVLLRNNKMNRNRTVVTADGRRVRPVVRTLPNTSFTKRLKLHKKRMENLYGKSVEKTSTNKVKSRRDKTAALYRLRKQLYKI